MDKRKMWLQLPDEQRNEYKELMIAFASLTKLFAQKAENGKEDGVSETSETNTKKEITELPCPFVNYKFQEMLFQRIFNATLEDKRNTSFDVSVKLQGTENRVIKYLAGIKTYQFKSRYQKIAQFKKEYLSFTELEEEARKNAEGLEKKEIDAVNKKIYKQIVKKVAEIRNSRIQSSIMNARGFAVEKDDDFRMVYHTLMTGVKKRNKENSELPVMYVGETEYEEIDIDNIRKIQCTGKNTPLNIDFSDGKHDYRFLAADNQLMMNFKNDDIILEEWDVDYIEDPFEFLKHINEMFSKAVVSNNENWESYSWKIAGRNKEVPEASGFNSCCGVSTKKGKKAKERYLKKMDEQFGAIIGKRKINRIIYDIKKLWKLVETTDDDSNTKNKREMRESIMKKVIKTENKCFIDYVREALYRPENEIYIPIPSSRKFHEAHPNFFGDGFGILEGKKLKNPKSIFSFVFEPSGEEMKVFLTQDYGKGIESATKQEILGKWILRKIYKLKPYELLTKEKMFESEINGIRLAKNPNTGKIHFYFIWIDDDSLPDDYIC